MRNRNLLLLVVAMGLSPPAMLSGQLIDPNTGTCSDPTNNSWTCIASNFNATNLTNPEYVWFNMHLTSVTGLPTSGGTVYFQDQFVTLIDGTNHYQYAVPDGSITFSNTLTPGTTYDASGWHTIVPTSQTGSNVFMAGLALQVPVGANFNQSNPVTWEGVFYKDPALTDPVSMVWQWSAAAYNCGTNTACQNAFADPSLLGVNQASEPTNVVDYVVGGARGGGGSNVTGSWSPTPHSNLADPLPAPPEPTIPEPTTLLLLGTGLAGVAARMRKRA